jgi:hypothetical protein
MTTTGIKPGDAVQLLERDGEQTLAHNALVSGFSMDELLAGTHGEPAIEACFVATRSERRDKWGGFPTLVVPGIVHVSHRDWIEGRAGLAYQELQAPATNADL